MKRTHIVLIPGFGGFDALGQIRYYVGLTPLFRQWHTSHPSATQAVLHYFDNLPTAAVVTRAARLRDYLAKRIARNEFQPGDEIALVGHSTGGLDIRSLILELNENPKEPVPIDGIQENDSKENDSKENDPKAKGALEVLKQGQILKMIKRVVFLSVPQYGTDIADWVNDYERPRRLMLGIIRHAVASHQDWPRFIRGRLTQFLATVSSAHLFCAARDAMRETDEYRCFGKHQCLDETRCSYETPCEGAQKSRSDAREAYSELRLWTQHTVADFGALQDLKCSDSSLQNGPAHFDALAREDEQKKWQGIATRSYATVSKCPFKPEELRCGRKLSLYNPWTWPDMGGCQQTDIIYRWSYRACAIGSFAARESQHTATDFDTGRAEKLERWDNDGIVNTASMLWPNGEATLLVKADHGDIIGHYKL